MQLCTRCGRVEDHDSSCPRRTQLPRTPTERIERIQRAVSVVQSVLAGSGATGKTQPHSTLLRLVSARILLDRYASTDLQSFADKRAHNEAGTLLAKKIAELEQELSAGAKANAVEDYAFARRAVELLFALASHRTEAATFDFSALGKLPLAPVTAPLARSTKDLSAEVEKRLEESRGLDAQVGAWGWSNLPALMKGEEPIEIPPELTHGAKAYLGAIVGRGPGTRRIVAATHFKLLGERFRERLYLLASNTILLRLVSRVAQAEEAWRRHLAKDDGAARWERLTRDGAELFSYVLGPHDGLPGKAEEVISRFGSEAGSALGSKLRPFDDLSGSEWEVFGMAYFFELAAIMGDLSSRDVGITGLASPLIERRRASEDDRTALDRALQSVRETWLARPPAPLKRPEEPSR